MLKLFRQRLEQLRTIYADALEQASERKNYVKALQTQAQLSLLDQIIEEVQYIQLGRVYHHEKTEKNL